MNKKDTIQAITHDRPAKPHDFIYLASESRIKGKMYKSPHGLWMIANDTLCKFRCVKCDTNYEAFNMVDVRLLNVEIAKTATCL